MKTFNKINSNFPKLFLLGSVVMLLQACATTKTSDYQTADGIYVSDETATQNKEATSQNNKSSYYKEYFKSKELTYKDVLEDEDKSAIFTDIDAYHTTESINEDGDIVIEERTYEDEDYGPWGENSSDVEVNIYNYGGAYGWYRPFWYRPFWWYNNWGWGYPYYGISYGLGFYSPWYYGGFYYNPYYYGYINPYYHNPYYNGYAYHRGRRNTDLNALRNGYRTDNRGRSNTTTNTRGNYSRSETLRRSNRNGFSNQNSNTIYRGRPSNSTINRGRPNTNSVNRGRPTSVNKGRPTNNNVNKGKPRINNNRRSYTPNHSSSRSGSYRGSSSGSYRGSSSGSSRSGATRGGRGGRGGI